MSQTLFERFQKPASLKVIGNSGLQVSLTHSVEGELHDAQLRLKHKQRVFRPCRPIP